MAVSYFPGRPLAQEYMPDAVQHRRDLARTANQAMRGLVNTTMSVTLTASATSTTIKDPRISLQTCMALMPTTANAAAALATTYVVCSAGQAVITHASNTQSDRIFTAAIQG